MVVINGGTYKTRREAEEEARKASERTGTRIVALYDPYTGEYYLNDYIRDGRFIPGLYDSRYDRRIDDEGTHTKTPTEFDGLTPEQIKYIKEQRKQWKEQAEADREHEKYIKNIEAQEEARAKEKKYRIEQAAKQDQIVSHEEQEKLDKVQQLKVIISENIEKFGIIIDTTEDESKISDAKAALAQYYKSGSQGSKSAFLTDEGKQSSIINKKITEFLPYLPLEDLMEFMQVQTAINEQFRKKEIKDAYDEIERQYVDDFVDERQEYITKIFAALIYLKQYRDIDLGVTLGEAHSSFHEGMQIDILDAIIMKHNLYPFENINPHLKEGVNDILNGIEQPKARRH